MTTKEQRKNRVYNIVSVAAAVSGQSEKLTSTSNKQKLYIVYTVVSVVFTEYIIDDLKFVRPSRKFNS